MRTGGIGFDFDSDECEEQNLPGPHGTVPHGPANTVAVGESRGCEKRGGPSPGADDTGCDEAGLDASGGGVEFFSLVGAVGRVAILEVGYCEPAMSARERSWRGG
jgi:hypothetical protein